MRPFDYDFLIDGHPILVPDEGVQITEKDIVISGTDESGVVHREILRPNVLSVSLLYAYMTLEEYRYMRSLVSGKAHFPVSFLDIDGQNRTITAHCDKIPISLYNKVVGLYKNFVMTITES